MIDTITMITTLAAAVTDKTTEDFPKDMPPELTVDGPIISGDA
jgi:hypothetical protein